MSSTASPSPHKSIRRQDVWMNTLVTILVLEFFITIAALCYGIITSPPQREGVPYRLLFPWVGWLACMLTTPALILVFVHFMTRNAWQPGTENSSTWEEQLPKRVQRLYRLIKDAPLLVVMLACIALSATLITIDGALNVLGNLGQALIPYLPYFIGGVVIFAIAIATLMAYFRYKNNQLQAEYAFRREVFEKTGVILVDSKSQALLPSDDMQANVTVKRLEAAPIIDALPAGEEIDVKKK